MLKISGLLMAFLASAGIAFGQWPGIYLQPLTIPGMPALHSFVYGTHNGKWVLVGGRKDGLHRRQASTAFADADNNKTIYVVDPIAGTVWSQPLSGLPTSISEQLSSTNMEFHQRDSILYCMGGYGYSATAANHITYPYLTAINVPQLMTAVMSGSPTTSCFRQLTDDWFAVTGGHLDMIYDVFYLVGGNKFTGRYNPMGGGSYTQEYTNQIRKMRIADDGTSIYIVPVDTLTDVANLHRRDYNLVPQIMPDGKEGLTAFSGVFQPTADIPYLNCVNIDSAGYALQPSFSQYYNHYHGANLAVYASASNEMHNFFLGGIAQYYDNAGTLVADNNVPFVKTIARVVRSADGTMTEYKLPVEMPARLGASAEVIPADDIPLYPNHVIDFSSVTADTVLAGYMVGGIESSAPNIFMINTGTESSASATVYKVFLTKGISVGADVMNTQSNEHLAFQVYPNPNEGVLFASFQLTEKDDIWLTVRDASSAICKEMHHPGLGAGLHTMQIVLNEKNRTGVYSITLRTAHKVVTHRLVLR